MQHFIAIIIISLSLQSTLDCKEEWEGWVKERNEDFRDSLKSPLKPDALLHFESLQYFPFDSSLCVSATLRLTPDSGFFIMPTTTGRIAHYRTYGFASFYLGNKEFEIPVYQNKNLMQKDEYKDHLFVPFTDLTNGSETYGGGRYLDVKKNDEPILLLNFNKAYNPYCAYNDRYSCPIPPKENHLDFPVRAGEKKPKK